MKKKVSELASTFKELRTERKLTQAECAKRAGLTSFSIIKIENDNSVRMTTLRDSIIKGLGLSEDSKEYKKMMSLWFVRRGAFDSSASVSRSVQGLKTSRNAKFSHFIDEVAESLKNLPPEKYEIFATALANPDIQEIIPRLHETFGPKVEE